jgi:hypothetical protein
MPDTELSKKGGTRHLPLFYAAPGNRKLVQVTEVPFPDAVSRDFDEKLGKWKT